MTMMRMRKISDVDVDEEDEDVTKVVPYSTYRVRIFVNNIYTNSIYSTEEAQKVCGVFL